MVGKVNKSSLILWSRKGVNPSRQQDISLLNENTNKPQNIQIFLVEEWLKGYKD